MTCDHAAICLTSSRFASVAGYKRPSAQALFTAATGSRKKHRTHSKLGTACPPPLLLPGDDLAEDPKYPPQSFSSWLKEPERNAITHKRKTIYVAAPPIIKSQVGFMQTWLCPRAVEPTESVAVPSANDVCEYLNAFYHGLEVKLLPKRLNYVVWSEDASHAKRHGLARALKSSEPQYVGLEVAGEITRIRTRHRHGASGRSLSAYAHQLNLDDILDCAISVLPEDAYALIILVDHDTYEDKDDDFCCGRAYGGSRVAVVSSAQYNPCLDRLHQIDREHCWPASHCLAFLEEKAKGHIERQQIERSSGNIGAHTEGASVAGPLEAALRVFHDKHGTAIVDSEQALQSMYLLRVARTASHELGHCLGMDHCTYYACAMQGTASTKEDSRQPPFLCPVCLNKLAHAAVELKFPKKAIHIEPALQYKKEWLRDRHLKMRNFCLRQNDSGFAALAAWTDAVLEDDPLQTVLSC